MKTFKQMGFARRGNVDIAEVRSREEKKGGVAEDQSGNQYDYQMDGTERR